MTLTIDGTPATQTVNLAAATSFSNAAEIIGGLFSIKGIQVGSFTASLAVTSPHMTVTALIQGAQQAEVTANLTDLSMTMVVTAVTGGYLEVGQVVSGTGITAGTTIAAYLGSGLSGGVGSYTLSASATATGNAVAVTSFAAAPSIAIGQVVTGTGIVANTYVSAFGSGTGGLGTYVLSTAPTLESAETILSYAPGIVYDPTHGAFVVRSGTLGASSSVVYATGTAAASLLLTQATGAVESPGAVASVPATFMSAITAQSLNWVSFSTTWEPTVADKQAFAVWNNGQDDQFVYEGWDTNVLNTESSGPSAFVAAVNAGNYSGTELIYTNPAITTLVGEKAAFAMSFTASLDFTRRNGRATAAFKSYIGGLPDITNGTIAQYLGGSAQAGTTGYGVNFYGDYTTRSQGFPQWQRGFISGPFAWKDSYVNQIWLNNSLQQAIMVGLTTVNSVPYADPGYATIESWCLDPIIAAVNFGAIVAGVQLSQAQAQEVNNAAGVTIDSTLTQRGWYLQVLPASALTRGLRASPPVTLWYCDGGAVQAINLASIMVQ
ncbi:MAG TPA: DUF3383 family protein, partial [Acidothermaceae bacterium]|nr:DUF3383 family protein [Acidothermaceae bacterium]